MTLAESRKAVTAAVVVCLVIAKERYDIHVPGIEQPIVDVIMIVGELVVTIALGAWAVWATRNKAPAA